MVMEGWLTNATFFPSTSIFCSLHLCSCFSLLVFSFSFLFLLSPLSLFVLVLLGLSLYYLCLFIFCLCFFVLCVCGSPLLCGFCLFVLIFLGLYWLVGSTTYGKGKLKFHFAGGRSQVSLSSLCLCFSSPLPVRLCVLWSL